MFSTGCQNGVLMIFSENKAWETENLNIFLTCELKFVAHLSCDTENSWNFWQISFVGDKFIFLLKYLGSKKLNYAAIRDLKDGGRGVKMDASL